MELMGGKEPSLRTPPVSRPGEPSQASGKSAMPDSEIHKIVGQVHDFFKGELEQKQLEKLKNSLTFAIKSNMSHDSASELKKSGLSLHSRSST